MKKALLIFLIMVSPAFAEGQKDDQRNIYDVLRQWEQKTDSAIVDEKRPPLIKRHMANLLYPVDMASFARPENDEKFRQQIIMLQKQMGAPATGTLTSDEYFRLADAARDIDDRPIAASLGKIVVRAKSGEWVSAEGTGTTDDTANPLAHPINITHIICLRSFGTCDLSGAEFSPEDSQLYFNAPPIAYSITTWEPTRVTATSENPCGTALLSIDIPTKSVGISSVPHSDLPVCSHAGFSTWRLADDGFPIIGNLHRDKVNKARALVYEPERKLVPPVVDASTK
jgi:hypothetical protein